MTRTYRRQSAELEAVDPDWLGAAGLAGVVRKISRDREVKDDT